MVGGAHGEQKLMSPGEPSQLEVLVIFQHSVDPDHLRSIHAYAQGDSLFSLQQDLLLSATCYRVLNNPAKTPIPNYEWMACFVDTQKKDHAAQGWICILDFGVFAPVPTSMSPLLSPSRNPFLSYLPTLHPDLQFVEAVIQKGCQGVRSELSFEPTPSVSSQASTCVTQSSDGSNVPFIGSRVFTSLSSPTPWFSIGLDRNSPQGSIWNDVGGSFTDLLSDPSPGRPMSPLGLPHPNFPFPRDLSVQNPGHFSGDQKHQNCTSPRPSTPPGLTTNQRMPRSPLFLPPEAFDRPRADFTDSPPLDFVPFVPGFFPDRNLGPWGTSTGQIDFHHQLAFLAEYPSFVGPEVAPGSLFEGFQRQQADPGGEEQLYPPPPPFEIPPFEVPGEIETLPPKENRVLITRSLSTELSQKSQDVSFQRASSAPAEISTNKENQGLLSPLRAGHVSPPGDHPASLWVCINAEASEGIHPGVAYFPPEPPLRTCSRGSRSSGVFTPRDQIGSRCTPPLLEPSPTPVDDEPVALICTPKSEASPRGVKSPGVSTPEDSPRESKRTRRSATPTSARRGAESAFRPTESGGVEEETRPQSPACLDQKSVRGVVMSRDPKRAAARMARMTLAELQTYFDMPIARAGNMLGVGLTVLKKRCRDFGIPRWPHRKIKSIKVLINTIKELAEPEDASSATAASFGDAVQRLEMEKEQIAGRPSIAMAQETLKLRQACFKASFRIRSLASGRNPRGKIRRQGSANSRSGQPTWGLGADVAGRS